ncbi:MAG: M23 family metallopeptidase [Candidatus Rokuibacteriota bacterium]
MDWRRRVRRRSRPRPDEPWDTDGRSTRRRVWLAVLLIVAFAGAFLLWQQLRPGVVLTLDPAIPALGQAPRTVTMRVQAKAGAVRSVEVRVVQGDARHTILREQLADPARELERPVTLEATALGLSEGPAELQMFARDTVWRLRPDPGPQFVQRVIVDLTPPTLELRATTGYVRHGGAGVAVYRVTGAARAGVRVGAAWFPGVTGLADDPAISVALFTVPWNAPPTRPAVIAEDEAGNQRVIEPPTRVLPRRFPKVTSPITEDFLRRKLPELAPATQPGASADELLGAFLEINQGGRAAAEARIRDLTQAGSTERPLWQGAFRQQPNTLVTARFPEERTYVWQGRVVDTRWHLGIDLASLRRSPVEAANAGRVTFAGSNGIYGNTILLDHGLGLFTMYAHLSELSVREGQTVAQGDILGRTGETGLADGDHLHFATLIHGVYTTPLEWWDERWLRDRVIAPLVDSRITLPGIADLGPPASTSELEPAPPAATTP